ncbi:hypothetical protein Csa_011588 [Cucumis sativus]|uniref:Uncharacterized protein n=1 Tax=Cucumis sativus TaxID=3659 RepID=A0A0A0L8R9_CUCSA|nr:hypothetical protein Csa_011588 [Cucumis sativus]
MVLICFVSFLGVALLFVEFITWLYPSNSSTCLWRKFAGGVLKFSLEQNSSAITIGSFRYNFTHMNFSTFTYLSFALQGLEQVLITGGIPPIGNGCTSDSVYRAAWL